MAGSHGTKHPASSKTTRSDNSTGTEIDGSRAKNWYMPWNCEVANNPNSHSSASASFSGRLFASVMDYPFACVVLLVLIIIRVFMDSIVTVVFFFFVKKYSLQSIVVIIGVFFVSQG